MSDYAKGVKKVPFDGTKENFYLWTTQLLGFTETYGCDQVLLGNFNVPPIHLLNLDANNPLDKILLNAGKAKSSTICLLRLSMTDKISQSALYNFKTTELPEGSAQKAWENFYKLFYPININKMNN
jgi:hypothetical protein